MESTKFNMVRSFVPEVDENKIPKVGMDFNNLEEAYTYYNGYAKVAGFSIRKGSDKKKKKGCYVFERRTKKRDTGT